MIWTIDEIAQAGENYAVELLRSKGWKIMRGTDRLGSVDIVASARSRLILARVKIALHPASPVPLTEPERLAIKSRAKKLRAEPWIANLTLDPDTLATIGDCEWLRLD